MKVEKKRKRMAENERKITPKQELKSACVSPAFPLAFRAFSALEFWRYILTFPPLCNIILCRIIIL